MKKLLIGPAVILFSSLVSTASAHELRLVGSDNSALTSFCLAAIGSKQSLSDTAKTFGFDRHDLQEIRCNGQALSLFISRFKGRDVVVSNDIAKPVVRKAVSSLQ